MKTWLKYTLTSIIAWILFILALITCRTFNSPTFLRFIDKGFSNYLSLVLRETLAPGILLLIMFVVTAIILSKLVLKGREERWPLRLKITPFLILLSFVLPIFLFIIEYLYPPTEMPGLTYIIGIFLWFILTCIILVINSFTGWLKKKNKK